MMCKYDSVFGNIFSGVFSITKIECSEITLAKVNMMEIITVRK